MHFTSAYGFVYPPAGHPYAYLGHEKRQARGAPHPSLFGFRFLQFHLYASFIAQMFIGVYRLGGHLYAHLGHFGEKQKTENRKQKLEEIGTSLKPMFAQSLSINTLVGGRGKLAP